MPHTRALSTVPEKRTRANSPAISETVSFEDLKSLAQAQGPCITVAVAIPDPAQRQAHLKNAIRDVENGLSSRGMNARAATTLVEPLRVFTAQIAAEGDWGVEFVLFKSRDTMRCFQVPKLSKEFVTVGDCFQIRTLLPLMIRSRKGIGELSLSCSSRATPCAASKSQSSRRSLSLLGIASRSGLSSR